MRQLAIRSLAGSAALAAALGLGVAADPPLVLPPPKPLDEPRKLRTELEALAAEREAAAKELTDTSPNAAERAKLRTQLVELIKKVGEKKAAPPALPMMPPASPVPMSVKEPQPLPAPPKLLPGGTVVPADGVRAAENYFRAGETDAALYTLTGLLSETVPLSREDRAFVQYLTGCCYRKKNQPADAMKWFREVADGKDDPFLTEQALTQISTIKSMQELEATLEQLRSRRKAK